MTTTATVILLLILAFGALLLVAEATRLLLDNPRGDIASGLYWWAARVYARLMHRVHIVRDHELRRRRDPGPLILISNHTAGVDPVLLQASLNFEPRWMMAQDMRHPALQPMWDYGRIIFVDREKGDLTGTREALRHLKNGGILGIFPEGRIERPARTLLPFHSGVGFIIKRSGVRVLPVVIEGTPDSDSAWGSLMRTSRTRLRFLDPIDYSSNTMSADEIAADLQRRYQEVTGWPVNDTTP